MVPEPPTANRRYAKYSGKNMDFVVKSFRRLDHQFAILRATCLATDFPSGPVIDPLEINFP